MNACEKYIAELATYLGPLTKADRDDALEFYDEYIADAQLTTRSAIEEKLGTAKQLSHRILADYSIKSSEQSTADGAATSTHNNWRIFWWVVLAILSSPLLFGVGIAALVLLIVVGGSSICLSGRHGGLPGWLSSCGRDCSLCRSQFAWGPPIRWPLLRGNWFKLNWPLPNWDPAHRLDYPVVEPASCQYR